MQRLLLQVSALLALALVVAACDSTTAPAPESDVSSSPSATQAQDPPAFLSFVGPDVLSGAFLSKGGPASGPSGDATSFAPPVYDISATPTGSILLAESVFSLTQPTGGTSTSTVKEITKQGIRTVRDIETVEGSPINGLEALGRGNFLATSGGLDLALGAGVWHVTRGTARLIGDIEAFEKKYDPDAWEGLQWKNRACEAFSGFSEGPQSNPYHLTMLPGGQSPGKTALVADAAGNTLLSVGMNGSVDWVAIFPPATADGSGSADPNDWLPYFPDPSSCYVQPVPTSVAVGPDGHYYVGELTGVTLADLGAGSNPTTGLSRIWRIKGGSMNVTCPSPDCQVAFSNYDWTSIIDVAVGPDGYLYVLQYDLNNWFAALGGNPGFGAISRCNVETEMCETVKTGLLLPGAVDLDKAGGLWLLENNIGGPTVRKLQMPM